MVIITMCCNEISNDQLDVKKSKFLLRIFKINSFLCKISKKTHFYEEENLIHLDASIHHLVSGVYARV